MKSSIFLENYELMLSIGIHEHERRSPQRYCIDIEMEIKSDLVFRNEDGIDGVFDYDFLRQEIASLAGSGHFETQEFFASQLIRRCASHAAIQRFRLWVRKPVAYPDCKSVGIIMELDSQDLKSLR